MKRSELWPAIRYERDALVATLRALTPDQWDIASLCNGWAVRDVVAHLWLLDDYFGGRPVRFAAGVARKGLNGFIAIDARSRAATATVDQLIDGFAATAYERALGIRLHPNPVVALIELIVHGQDIRRPAGIRVDFAEEHLRAALTFLAQRRTLGRRVWGSPKWPSGLRFEAADIDWSSGRGRVVRQPAETLIMGLAGRLDVLDLAALAR